MAIITSISLRAIVRSISVFGFWGWLDLIGSVIVAIGCLGELWLLLNKIPEHNERRVDLKGFWLILSRIEATVRPLCKRLKLIRSRKSSALKEHLIEGFFNLLVTFGIGMELISLPFSLWDAAMLGNRVEVLRKANNELEAEIQPRNINPKQTMAILTRLREVSGKCRVIISYNQPDLETAVFALRLRDVIAGCGYEWKVETTFFTWDGAPSPTGVSLQTHNPPPSGARELANAFADVGVFATNTLALDPGFQSDVLKISVWLKPLPEINLTNSP